jgi:hypothetical protein
MQERSGLPELNDSNAQEMRQLVMRAFVGLLHETNLAPMTVLKYAAAAMGSVYRDVAAAHRGPGGCPCGWEPDERRDIALLQAALAREAQMGEWVDLATANVAGNA